MLPPPYDPAAYLTPTEAMSLATTTLVVSLAVMAVVSVPILIHLTYEWVMDRHTGATAPREEPPPAPKIDAEASPDALRAFFLVRLERAVAMVDRACAQADRERESLARHAVAAYLRDCDAVGAGDEARAVLARAPRHPIPPL